MRQAPLKRLLPSLIVTCVLAGLAVAGGPVRAAPVPACPQGAGTAEPMHCDAADLAAAETRVAAALASASARLSSTGRARLRDDQASWRKLVDGLCRGGAGGRSDEASVETVDCLKEQDDIRLGQLARAVIVTGNVTFYRAERFELRPAANSSDAARPVRLDVAWPQLDHAGGRGQTRWNEAMAKEAEALAQPPDKEAPDTDVTVDWRVESVLPGLIQTLFWRELYIHGAAHGDNSQASSLFLLREARPLVAEDLFDPGKAWRTALARAAFTRLEAAAAAGGWTLWPKEPEEIASLAADPERWLIAKDGLSVVFDAYDVADYAAGPQNVVIPWNEVTPLLKPAPALKLPP